MGTSGCQNAVDDPINIPIAADDALAVPSINLLDEAKRKRILIVEDNYPCVTLLNDVLKAHGYETLETTKGLEAINLARDYRPDLILMDIRLPDISGLEVTCLLKQDQQTKCIPIIAVTAFAMLGDEAKALQSGCDAYIAKPIVVDNLLRTVASFLSPLPPIGSAALMPSSEIEPGLARSPSLLPSQ
jgi:two-component system cell cycle response regulator DivK